jgi:tetratricopeptide (TPR) repeat protein
MNKPTLCLLAALALAASAAAHAGPMSLKDMNLVKPPKTAADTPAAQAFRKGVAALMKNKLGAARDAFRESLRLDSGYVPAMTGLADIAQREGDRAAARKLLAQAEAANPKAADVHVAWGRLHLKARDLAAAEKSFQHAHKLQPDSTVPLLELGSLLMTVPGRQAEAMATLETARQIAPTNIHVLFAHGTAAALAGQHAKALASFEQVAATLPKDPEPLRAIGRLHLEQGDADRALAAFDRALKLQPQSVALMMDRTDALARAARWPDAVAQQRAAAKAAPKSADVQLKLGDVLQEMAQYKDARAAYLEAIRLDPKNALAHNNLAWMTLREGGAASDAVHFARQAVALSPGSAPFLDTLGWAERASGNLVAADATLRKAVQIEPNNREFKQHRDTVLAELRGAR